MNYNMIADVFNEDLNLLKIVKHRLMEPRRKIWM